MGIETNIITVKKSNLINQYLNILPQLINNVATEVEITPIEYEKYKFDFIGLLKNKLSVEEKFIIPHIIVNGLVSSEDFNYNISSIKLIDKNFLTSYHDLLNK